MHVTTDGKEPDLYRYITPLHNAIKKAASKAKRKLAKENKEEKFSQKQIVSGVLDMAISRFTLSFRSIKKIQKVGRTIADLDSSEVIRKSHILEALSYRRR